jgi:hypothetical protein
MLKRIPAQVETEATNPTWEAEAPRWSANRGNTGLFAIVELKIAKNPIAHTIIKGLRPMF